MLTDLRMPVKDGIEVMDTINKKSPNTPMIVVSGAGRQDDIIKALRMGAKDYITKPIEDIEIINHVVRRVLENIKLQNENKLYRKRLEKSERQYRTITENIAEGVFTIDKNENITYTNEPFCNMLAFSDNQLLKMNLKDITTKIGFEDFLKHIQSNITGLSSRFVIKMLNKNDDEIHVEIACNSVYDDKNRYKSTIAIVRDITKTIKLRKKYQKFLLRKQASSKDLLPICASCKNVRDEHDEWIQVEDYFSDVVFSHGICPRCCDKLYPEFDFSELEEEEDNPSTN